MNDHEKSRTEKSGIARPESAVALEKFRKPLIEYLVSALDHPDKWVRYMAADMIGAAGDTDAIGHLMPLLVCDDKDLRAVARQSLETACRYRTVPLVHSAGPECTNCLIRSIAEEALDQLKQRDPCPPL